VQVMTPGTPPAGAHWQRVIVRIFERELEIRELTTMALLRRIHSPTRKAKCCCPMQIASSTPRARHDRSCAKPRTSAPMPRLCASGCSINAAARHRKACGASLRWCALARPYRRAGRHGGDCSGNQLLQGCPASGRAVACAGARAPRDDTAPPLTQQHELIREPTEYAEFFRQRSDAFTLEPNQKGDL